MRTTLGPAGVGSSGLPESTVLGEEVGPSESHGTSGIYAVGDRLAALIDVEALFAPGEDTARNPSVPGGEQLQ